MLLIITNEEDIHPNPVIDHLLLKKVPFFRLNTENLYTHYDISYRIDNDSTYFEISYKTKEHKISSKEISCVWERRPCEPLATYDPYDEKISKVLLEEGEGFLRFFRYSLDNIPWIGDAVLERKAGSKILQKIIAKQVGFKIPSTLFTNSINDVKNFQADTIAIKPISAFGVEKNDTENIIFYTTKHKKENILKLGEKSLRNNVNFFEEYIDKDFEVRVTIVVDEAFSVKINSQNFENDKGRIDWRQGYDHGISFKATEIPFEVKQKCFSFLKYFGLTFGCFDFIVSKTGEYFFLECNTNGQWLWIEEEANLPISKKIAEVFEKYSKTVVNDR